MTHKPHYPDAAALDRMEYYARFELDIFRSEGGPAWKIEVLEYQLAEIARLRREEIDPEGRSIFDKPQ